MDIVAQIMLAEKPGPEVVQVLIGILALLVLKEKKDNYHPAFDRYNIKSDL
jgi:hypothetical protein